MSKLKYEKTGRFRGNAVLVSFSSEFAPTSFRVTPTLPFYRTPGVPQKKGADLEQHGARGKRHTREQQHTWGGSTAFHPWIKNRRENFSATEGPIMQAQRVLDHTELHPDEAEPVDPILSLVAKTRKPLPRPRRQSVLPWDAPRGDGQLW